MIKGRLLIMGCILIVLGLVLFVARGFPATLGLVGVGAVLLIAGVIYRPKPEEKWLQRQTRQIEFQLFEPDEFTIKYVNPKKNENTNANFQTSQTEKLNAGQNQNYAEKSQRP